MNNCGVLIFSKNRGSFSCTNNICATHIQALPLSTGKIGKDTYIHMDMDMYIYIHVYNIKPKNPHIWFCVLQISWKTLMFHSIKLNAKQFSTWVSGKKPAALQLLPSGKSHASAEERRRQPVKQTRPPSLPAIYSKREKKEDSGAGFNSLCHPMASSVELLVNCLFSLVETQCVCKTGWSQEPINLDCSSSL